MIKGDIKMKKEYTKPQIAFESFEISCAIANTCNVQAQYDANTCPIDLGFGTIFSAEGNCDFLTEEGAYEICYYVPTMDSTVFSS